MKTPRALFLALLVLLPFAASAQAQGDGIQIFLRLAGITDPGAVGHESDIGALSVSFGAGQTGLTAAGGAASPAKAQLSTITIQKLVDKTSPTLFIDCALGKMIPSATITFRDPNQPGGPVDNFSITLTNVLVSSYHVDATTGDNGITESIGLSYITLKVSYTPVDPNGTLGTPVSGTFNVQSNKQVPNGPDNPAAR